MDGWREETEGQMRGRDGGRETREWERKLTRSGKRKAGGARGCGIRYTGDYMRGRVYLLVVPLRQRGRVTRDVTRRYGVWRLANAQLSSYPRRQCHLINV